MMIRVERGEEIGRHGIFAYRVPSHRTEGRSRQPLSDACRQLKSMGVATETAVGLFHEGCSEPSLVSTVGRAAGVTVSDPDGGRVKFVKFRKYEAAE